MIERLIKGALRRLLRLARRLKFQVLSTNTWTGHTPTQNQPLLLAGSGTITFQTNVRIGVSSSPKFWSSECYIEARSTSAKVEIGQNTWINNGFSAISENGSIFVGRDCFIGHDVFIIDSDFHQLDPDIRHMGKKSISQPVHIGNNVFIGSRVTILKNAHIGDGSVVAASAVVSGTFPARSLIAGNPARLIRTL
jgi:acetyltransferase-like isoleucine patch superfamily enzyme